MAVDNFGLLAFNRGRVSPKALARVDVKRMAFSADVQTNMVPRVLGSMSFRPGMGYLLTTSGSAQPNYIDFIFSTTDTALLEFTAAGLRIIKDDAVITRVAVTSAVANGLFTTDLTSWTDNDEAGATSAWATGGYLSLVGTKFKAAIRRQQVTTVETNVEHAVRFVIERGPVSIKIGSTTGGAEYISEKTLGTGTYSFVFTPTGNFHIEVAGRAQAASLVDSVAVEASGDFLLPVPWALADLATLTHAQSADVVFIASNGFQQRRIDRYDTACKSWGISLYQPEDGPFRIINTSDISMTPSALVGDITLTASREYFTSTQVGGLIGITSQGQTVSADVGGNAEYTNDDSMRVIGVANSRIFTTTITGTWVGTIVLQRSIDETGSWVDVTSWTTNHAATNYDDGLDNSIAYYRIGFKDAYSSGTATVTLIYPSGGIKGIARITAYTSSTVVSAAVLSNFGATTASRDWSEGSWSTRRGFPQAVAFYEGRLWWAGKGFFYGSISDAFTSFDEDFEGDAGPIVRSIASGPVDNINWLLSVQRLIAGTAGAEVSARSTSFDEPLTPSNFNLKNASTQGSSSVPALVVDSNGIFVQRGGTRIFEMGFSFEKNDYKPTDLTDIVPEICEPSVTLIALQRQPDTRLHVVKSDGTVALLIREPDNEVLAWVDVVTDGSVVDVVVLPGTVEDTVYYCVKRTINGSDVHYLEKWALESEAVGGTTNKMADSFITFTNPTPRTLIEGLTHLIAEEVVVWADGKCLKDAAGDIETFTVDGSGQINVTNEGVAYNATTGVVGLPYQGRFKSTKLAYATSLGTALTQRKRLSHLGMIMANTHAQGVRYGPDFTTMDDLPLVDDEGAVIDTDTIHSEFDKDMFEWPGGWGTDERMCLECNAPRPATIMGVVVGIDETDKV